MIRKTTTLRMTAGIVTTLLKCFHHRVTEYTEKSLGFYHGDTEDTEKTRAGLGSKNVTNKSLRGISLLAE